MIHPKGGKKGEREREREKGEQETTRTAINLLTSLCGIASLLEADEREPLRPLRVPVLGQKDPRDAAEAFEYLPQILLFREFGNLCRKRNNPSAKKKKKKKKGRRKGKQVELSKYA